FIGEPSHCYPY
ncbi:hypothetical protein D043_5260B, partial [Vibrio parahaemolyticus EKP-021]